MRHDSDQIPTRGRTFQNSTSDRPEVPDATRFHQLLIGLLVASNTQNMTNRCSHVCKLTSNLGPDCRLQDQSGKSCPDKNDKSSVTGNRRKGKRRDILECILTLGPTCKR